MRPSPHGTWVVSALCGGCVGVWLLQQWTLPLPVGTEEFALSTLLERHFALHAQSLRAGALWQAVTYALLHGSLLHLGANLVGLWISGRTLVRFLGKGGLLWLLLLGALGGAAGYVATLLADPRLFVGTPCMGASAMVAACLGAATTLLPKGEVTLWVGLFPIHLRAGWLAPLVGLGLLAEAWVFPQVTAYGAHLGGYLVGLALGWAFRPQHARGA